MVYIDYLVSLINDWVKSAWDYGAFEDFLRLEKPTTMKQIKSKSFVELKKSN